MPQTKVAALGVVSVLSVTLFLGAATTRKHYFAHDAVVDRYGVIAPWYRGQNGQFDERVRVAAETMKRYPWVSRPNAVADVPAYVLNGTWRINADGEITIPKLSNWANGDLGQMAAREIAALVAYYRYSGDPSALAQISLIANTVLDHCLTSENFPWSRFLISVPVMGKPYGDCDPRGWIQLDIVSEAGVALLHAYEITGQTRWLEAVKHWADVLAAKRSRLRGATPWGRYANPEEVKWGLTKSGNLQTGGVVYELTMLDELIRLGYRGDDDSLIMARDAARDYLRNVLLPHWTVNDTWGRNYWDWEDPVQAQTTTEWTCRYLMANKDLFPNWRNDVRNLLTLFLNHTGVSPDSQAEVYSGAWAFPESSGCCRSSLAWAPVELAGDFAEYGVEAHSAWAKELARRMLILGTYDFHENGLVEDNIFGGQIAAGGWFIAAHPSMLLWTLDAMSWLPGITGANRENHIMRSSRTVNSVVYQKGKIIYSTFDAPPDSVDVLRLAFEPHSVMADGKALARRNNLDEDGYVARRLPNGDYIVSIRHDGEKRIVVDGNDPQIEVDDGMLAYHGAWRSVSDAADSANGLHISNTRGATVSYSFVGNQVRVIGAANPRGGRADVYLDGVKQLAGIDFWNPTKLDQQVVYCKTGLENHEHTIKIVAQGSRNPVSAGDYVYIDAIQFSAATGENGFGEGGGPRGDQRFIFGYTGRKDYVDTHGHKWRPGTEFVVRTGALTDAVAKTWWTKRQAVFVRNTPDPELYRYGIHWPDFVVNISVGPGTYHVRLKLAETQYKSHNQRAMTIAINGKTEVDKMDLFATAGGSDKAVDLVYNNVQPQNGMITIHFEGDAVGGCLSEAVVQAIEVGPGNGGHSAKPKSTED